MSETTTQLIYKPIMMVFLFHTQTIHFIFNLKEKEYNFYPINFRTDDDERKKYRNKSSTN